MSVTMLLDASSLVYRAFFSVPKTITDHSGNPVNAVRGFMDMSARLKIERGPDEVIAVFDADWRPAFRVAAYPGFKADRPEEPPELTTQFDLLPAVLDAAGMPRAEASGYEADDVIATLCATVSGDDRALVVTGDRDLICLVRDPHVGILFTLKGVTNLKLFDEAAVEETYGLPPSRYSEFAMLRGDPSDGLPGVPGVGPKTAVKLLREYGSIDEVIAHSEDLTPRLRQAFDSSREYLAAMRTVVPPVTDLKVESTVMTRDEERLLRLAAQHNIEGPARRLLQALGDG
ncbi:MAG: 5'-3' exonuclease [Actinomycetota bacterium]